MDINTAELSSKISELEQALLEKHPRMPILLSEVHKTLSQYPEQVTLLDEKSISIIVNGLLTQTQSEFATIVTKSASKGTGSIAAKVKSGTFEF